MENRDFVTPKTIAEDLLEKVLGSACSGESDRTQPGCDLRHEIRIAQVVVKNSQRVDRKGPYEKVMEIPFIPTSYSTRVIDGKTVVVPAEPEYVQALRKGNWKNAVDRLATAIMVALAGETTFSWKCYDAPIAVSSQIAAGCYSLDWSEEDGSGNRRLERIVVNEAEMEDRAIDADGDRGAIIEFLDMGYGVLVKYPFTKGCPVLKKIDDRIEEVFESFDMKEAPGSKDLKAIQREAFKKSNPDWEGSDEKLDFQVELAEFAKAHKVSEVGILTSAWNSYEAYEMASKAMQEAPYIVRASFLGQNPQRYAEIEGKMKASRKDGREEVAITDKGAVTMKGIYKGLLVSRNARINPNKDTRLEIQNVDLQMVANKVRKLAFTKNDFEVPKSGKGYRQLISRELVDNTLIQRAMGIFPDDDGRKVQVPGKAFLKVIGMAHPAFPDWKGNVNNWNDPCNVMVLLVQPKGPDGEYDICGLTDVKREDGMTEGLTYGFVLTPVWNAEAKRWLHPMKNMEIAFQTFRETWSVEKRTPQGEVYREEETIYAGPFRNLDVIISTPMGDERLWLTHINFGGKVVDDMATYTEKRNEFREAVQTYVASVGWPIDGEKDFANKAMPIKISKAGRGVCMSTLAIDYCKETTNLDIPGMFETAKLAEKTLGKPLVISGNKQLKRRYRKYAIGKESGVAIWAHETNHPARTGKISSQLVRGLHSEEYTVAIFDGPTKSQCYITPSGIKKHATDLAFLRRVFNTASEAVLALEGQNKDWSWKAPGLSEPRIQELSENYLYEGKIYAVELTLWGTGDQIVVFNIDPKQEIELGKLIGGDGQKFMPRRVPQYYDAGGREIDVLVPIEELKGKRAAESMLEKAEMHRIHSKDVARKSADRVIEVPVTTMQYWRTGAYVENVPGRERIFTGKQMDQHQAAASINRCCFTERKYIEWAVGHIEDQTWALRFEYIENLMAQFEVSYENVIEDPRFETKLNKHIFHKMNLKNKYTFEMYMEANPRCDTLVPMSMLSGEEKAPTTEEVIEYWKNHDGPKDSELEGFRGMYLDKEQTIHVPEVQAAKLLQDLSRLLMNPQRAIATARRVDRVIVIPEWQKKQMERYANKRPCQV